jgi:NAD(P)-dependent dehydrogenase (short-subunit alcohol dehydrogenase family)
LITGTSSGFGRLTAETLARNGFFVLATLRDSTGRNAEAAAEIRALASRESLALVVCDMDVTDELSVEKCVAGLIRKSGRIDVLVNNAGFGYIGLTETFTLEQARRIFDTNFFGVQRTIRAVLPQMHKQRSGLLLQVSSGGGRVAVPGMGLYCASKFALEALTECYRCELAGSGIDSVSLEPGAFRTEIFGKIAKGDDPARASAYGAAQEIPIRVNKLLEGTTADPQEVADAALRIIQTPFRERALRYRVGSGAPGVAEINALTDQVQRQLLLGFGLADLTEPRTSSRATA